MAPKGRRPPASSGPAPASREWGHPDGFQLSEVDVDAEYDAVVTNVGTFGVFVDFGAVKDALLKVPVAVGRGLKKGMEVNHLAVLSCDPDSGKIVLTPQDATVLPEPQSRKKTGGGAGARSGSQTRSVPKDSRPRRKPREWGHSDATPLEELQEGEVWDGTVTNVGPYGVFVDIGAVRDARLNVSAKIGRRFRVGDVVPDCKVELVDVENGRVSCLLEDPDEVVKDLEPKPRVSKTKAKASPGRQPQALATMPTAKPKAKAKQAGSSQATSIERLRVGQVVNGIVSNKNNFGIFVDIGVGKDAKLNVPRRMMSSFKRRDEIYDMRVESVDLEKAQISVAIDDPELMEPMAAPRVSAAAGKKAAAKPKAKPKAKQQDWSHPDALPISSFRVGQECNGVVTKIGPQGVFIDIAAVRDGILKLPREVAKQFQPDDEVQGMMIEAIDLANERITLSLEDPELNEPQPQPPPRKALATRPEAKKTSGAPASKAKSQAKAKPKAKAKGAGGQDWSHNDGIPLDELVVGSEVNGVVTNRGSFGVFLDIGAVKDGKLQLQRNQWRKFEKGDEVEDMVIDHVDLETEQISLALTYELGDEPMAYEAPEALPKPKAKSAGNRQPQALSDGSAKAAVRPAARSPVAARSGAAKSKARARGSDR